MDEHAQKPRLRVAMVTNIPAPYRIPVYDHLARDEGIDLCVIFCADREPDRDWDLPPPAFRQVVLRPRQLTVRDRYIHVNFDVWGELARFAPDVVVTTGYNPTHLLAWAYARRRGVKHVVMTDGTFRFEQGFSALHRWVRRRVMASSRAFIGASDGALELFGSYGVAPQDMFRSQLCTDNTRFQVSAQVDAPHHDLMFSGRFAPGKLPLFALDVACATGQRLGRRVRLLMVGAGPLEAALRERACAPDVAAWVECSFPGFARQAELPAHYASASVFLFTTERDAWGVVANEACAAGLPVIITPEAGVADELVVHGDNGYVLAPVVSAWSEAAAGLLADAELRRRMGERSRERVRSYTYANAAGGIAAAARHAMADHSTHHPRPTVLIVQRRLTHYRVVLFERLRMTLDQNGVELRLVYGEAASREMSKRDGADLAWAQRIPTRYALRGRACWQNVTGAAKRADLVIVTQENRLMFNYVLHALKPAARWALWGHGRNFQAADPNSMPERFKRWFLRKPDWWFAYTERSASVVRQAGYAADRITVLNNALDTDALRAPLSAAELEAQAQALRAMAIGPGPVGMLLGSLYADKRIDAALQAARLVRREVPDFQLLIVGDGPLRRIVQDAASASHAEGGWIRWLGRRTDTDKAALLRRADLLLNPGALGLVMLDSFASGTPLVTCDLPTHGPESAYLRHGVNGWVAPADAPGYANEVCRLLQDPATRAVLRQGCLRDAQIYTLDAMVERFCQGVLACLAAPPRRHVRRAAAAGTAVTTTGSKGTVAS